MARTAPTPLLDRSVPRARDVEDLLAVLCTSTDDRERIRLRNEVVGRFLTLADSLAHRYAGRGIDREDLEQVARTALVAAVDRYRPGTAPGARPGTGFVAFAVPTITGELKRHFRDCGWAVRPPRRVQELRAQVAAAEDSLRHRVKREVSTTELAASVGCTCAEVDEARLATTGFRASSLDAPTRSGDTEGERVADERDVYAALELRADLRRAIGTLPPGDRLIVRMRFVDGCTQAEIGTVIGVSQMQVSRLLCRILADLRLALDADDRPARVRPRRTSAAGRVAHPPV